MGKSSEHFLIQPLKILGYFAAPVFPSLEYVFATYVDNLFSL